MNTLAHNLDHTATDVRFDADSVLFDLADGRTLSAPLAWFPRLLTATSAQRENWEFIGKGYGVHWPDVDEDISVLGLQGLPDQPGCGTARELSEFDADGDTMPEYVINLSWDEEAAVWIATSEDIPGLVLESGSLDALIERVRFAAPELLSLNTAGAVMKQCGIEHRFQS